MRCAFTDCNNVRNFSLSFFQIPNDHRREIWKKHSRVMNFKCKRPGFCEKHFYSKDIMVKGTKKCLKQYAIPISSPTVCKCTESVVDDECYRIMDSGIVKVKEKILCSTAPLLLNTATINDDALNTANKVVEGGNNLKSTVIPPSFSCEQLQKNKIIDNPLPPSGERTYLKKKLVNVLPDAVPKAPEKTNNAAERPRPYNDKMTSELSKSSISIGDQIPIVSEHKEIECLEAVVKYTSQMQNIVKQKGGLDSFIQANTHLIKLLDKVVYEWFQRAQRRIEIGVITNELFMQKALECKQIFCIQNFDPDHDWLNKLKTKYNITDLDMRLLHIQNNSFPPSVDIYEIVLHVLKNNPITEYFSKTTPNDDTILVTENNIEMRAENEIIPKTDNEIETVVKIEEMERPDQDTDMEVPIAISNDEQARLHLKPLEEYVLLKDNFRAVGLISQLIEIFSAEIKKEET